MIKWVLMKYMKIADARLQKWFYLEEKIFGLQSSITKQHKFERNDPKFLII